MDTQVIISIDRLEKEQLDFIFANLELTTDQAFNIFARKSIEIGGFPFELPSPNNSLQNAINSQDYNSFNSADEGLTYLNGGKPSRNRPYESERG